jgi:hypothetical protein
MAALPSGPARGAPFLHGRLASHARESKAISAAPALGHQSFAGLQFTPAMRRKVHRQPPMKPALVKQRTSGLFKQLTVV